MGKLYTLYRRNLFKSATYKGIVKEVQCSPKVFDKLASRNFHQTYAKYLMTYDELNEIKHLFRVLSTL